MPPKVFKPLDRSYGEYVKGVLQWQEQNEGFLALLPKRWEGLNKSQKWALLRILALRAGYTPDWVDPEIWAGVRQQMMYVTFEDETDLLEASSPEESAEERDFREIISGKAPQSFREGP